MPILGCITCQRQFRVPDEGFQQFAWYSTSECSAHVNLEECNREPQRIFSGAYSKDMWREINGAESIEDLKSALYTVCCRLQELEAKIAKDIPNIELESFGTAIVPNSRVIVNGKRFR